MGVGRARIEAVLGKADSQHEELADRIMLHYAGKRMDLTLENDRLVRIVLTSPDDPFSKNGREAAGSSTKPAAHRAAR